MTRASILLSFTAACCAGSESVAADAEDADTSDGVIVAGTNQSETASDDQQFISTAVVCCMLEIRASRVALAQQNMPANVKDAAKQLIDDHAMLDDKISRIAIAEGYAVPSALDKASERKLTMLQDQNGKGLAFLKAYDAFQVKAHKDEIALFADASKDTKDPDLCSFAIDALPWLRENADMVSQLPYALNEIELWKSW